MVGLRDVMQIVAMGFIGIGVVFSDRPKGQFPVRKNTAKCEKVRAKYVTGMRSDISQRVRAKEFLSEKSSLEFNFFSFRLRNSFADQSEFVFVWQVATFQLHDVIINRPK